MKTLIILIALIVTCTTSFSADLRNVSWGDSKKKVMAIEKVKPDYVKKDALGFKSSLAGIKTLVLYNFENDKLVNAIITNYTKHTNTTDYIDDYNTMLDLLSKKYGAPDKESIDWKNDLYKNDPQHWGMAVAVGHLSYFSGWKIPRSYISLMLDGDRFEVNQRLLYHEKNSFEKSTVKSEQNNIDQL
jgi:hypothetical protein